MFAMRVGAEDERYAVRAKQGAPVAGVDMRIVDDAGNVLPWDGKSAGEIQVRGPWVTGGYYNNPEGAAQFTEDGWFRTGDVATIGPDGWHRILGRASVDLIKSGGYRIGAGEIEAALLTHPAVGEVAVVGDAGGAITEADLRPDVDIDLGAAIRRLADEGFADAQKFANRPTWNFSRRLRPRLWER